MERADGELMVRYQGEAVEFQEGPSPSSALWGADSGCSPDPELQETADGVVHSHLNVWLNGTPLHLGIGCSGGGGAQRRQGEASAPPVAPDANVNPAGPLGGCTAGQGARAVPPGHRHEPGHGPRHRGGNTSKQKVHPLRNSAPRSTPRARPWPHHQPPQTNPGDIFAFHLRGHNRWTTTDARPNVPGE